MRPFYLPDSHLFHGRTPDLLAASHALGSIANGQIFAITGPPDCGKTSFAHACLLASLIPHPHSAHATLDLSGTHDLRAHTARSLLSATSQAQAKRLTNRLAELILLDPTSAAEFFRDFIRANLPTDAPPTPVVVDHLERLLSKDNADLLPGGIPDQSRAGSDVLATLTALARLPEITVIATARSLHFQRITQLAPDGASLYRFPLAPVSSPTALAEIFHVSAAPGSLRAHAADLISRYPAALPFLTSLLARLHRTHPSYTHGSHSEIIPEDLLAEVISDHADALLESLPWSVDAGFNHLFRLFLPGALSLGKNDVQSNACPVSVPLDEIGSEWEIRRAANALVDCRILTVRESVSGTPYLEASFPPFFPKWKLAAKWIARSRFYARTARDIEAKAQAWMGANRHSRYLLLSGSEKEIASRIAEEDPDRLSADALDFVSKSRSARIPRFKNSKPEGVGPQRPAVLPFAFAALLLCAGLWFSFQAFAPYRSDVPKEPTLVLAASGEMDDLESALQPISYTGQFEPSADPFFPEDPHSHSSAPYSLSHPLLPLPVPESSSPATARLIPKLDEVETILPGKPVSAPGVPPNSPTVANSSPR